MSFICGVIALSVSISMSKTRLPSHFQSSLNPMTDVCCEAIVVALDIKRDDCCCSDEGRTELLKGNYFSPTKLKLVYSWLALCCLFFTVNIDAAICFYDRSDDD